MTKSTLKLLFFFFCVMFSLASKGQVIADFTASDTSACVPKIISFTNTSTGATSYSWDLGNSATSFFTDASGSYTSAGTYTVSLTAFNGPLSQTIKKVIRIYDLPSVNFSATDTAVCPGIPTNFVSTSVSNAWGPMTYNWNFGDGYNSTLAAPSHPYVLPGYYSVSLFVTSAPGCVSSLVRGSYIHTFTPALVNFSATDSFFCKAPGSVHFTNTTTGFAPLSYFWRFGDGGTITGAPPTHNYTTPGSYNVTLKVTDGHSCVDSLYHPGFINVGTLAARFTAPAAVCKYNPVSFINTSTTHIGSKWTFGDGDSSFLDMPVHTYSANGTYAVKLIVDDGTCRDTIIHPITVNAPSGTVSISPSQPCPAPNTLTFSASVPAGCTVSWLFGDTTAGTGTPITHLYHVAVIDTQSMIITDAAGCRDTTVFYDTSYTHTLQVSATPTQGCIPLTVNFSTYDFSTLMDPVTLLLYNFPYPYATVSYTWDYGDGTPTGSGPTPTHIYTSRGAYTVVCTMRTANGCSVSSTTSVICGVPPVASFSITPRRACNNVPIKFTNTTVGANSFYWYYGDIVADSCTCPVKFHTYVAPGNFTPHLLAYDNGCGSAPVYSADTVDPPKAVMHLNYSCTPRTTVTFTDFSIGATSLLWMFGDGYTSTSPIAVHTYTVGTASASLATYNAASGCRDTASIMIDVAKPVVQIYARDSAICRDKIDTFKSVFTSTLVPIRYKWFIDGVITDSLHNPFIYNYHVRGIHSIMLVNTDNHGCLDTSNSNSLIVAKPIAAYSVTPSSGCYPLPVMFTDYSTDVAGVSVTKYMWTFGDGATSTLTSSATTHTYTTAGVFNIKEILLDSEGCRDTLQRFSTPTVYKPIASFSVTATSVCANATAHFTNISTGISSALWYFGDGTRSTLLSPDHVYTANGTYTIKLVVFDTHGCNSDTMTRSNYITVNPSPLAAFSMSDSFAVCPPLNISFTNTSAGAVSYYWMFGDGSYSVAFSPTNVYGLSAPYTIQLEAKNAFGCVDTATRHASIFGYRGAFSYTPVTGCAPLLVHYRASLSHIMNLTWDFNDGITSSTSVLDTISHTYRHPGAYLPKLLLTDSSGCSNFSIGLDTIKADTLAPAFMATPAAICQFNSISFTDASTSLYSADTSWLWSFGSSATSSLTNPSYTFTSAGTIPITLTVTNRNRCTYSKTQSVVVNPLPLPITGATNVCTGMTTTLSNTGSGTWSSAAAPGTVLVGSASGVITGVATGSAVITYTLPSGCSNTQTVTVYPAPAPIAGPASLCRGTTIALTDATAGGTWTSSAGSVASVGTISGIVTGVAAGTATITYANAATVGCVALLTVTVIPVPVAIAGAAAVCEGQTIALTDATPGGSWISGNTAVATAGSGSGTVYGVTAGSSTITYSISGCLATKTVTVKPLAPITGTTTICAGLSTTLSTSIPGGTWISSNTAVASINMSTGTVFTFIFGTSTITYTTPTGCVTTTTVDVNSVPLPLTGAPKVCVGTILTLTGSGGGVWTSASPSVASIGSSTGDVTGVSVGTATVTYSFGSGCSSFISVSVYAPPLPVTGVPQMCAGAGTILSDLSPGGVWSSGAPGIATVNPLTGFATGPLAGTATISYSRYGCSATYDVTVNPLPATISGTTDVCIGFTTTLSNTLAGGTWTSSNPSVATAGIASGIVTGVANGGAIITYTLPTGCTTTIAVTVNLLPLPITGPARVCEGKTMYASDATPGGSWSSGNMLVATVDAASGLVTGVTAGSTVLTYTLSTGCPAIRVLGVDSLPGAITGTPVACVGLTNLLTAPVAGGVWTSSNFAIASVVYTTGLVTGVTAGLVTITYTLPTGCTTTIPETVNPLPRPIAGPASVCAGETINLTDITFGGAWSSSVTAAATVISYSPGTGIVTGVTPGTTVISYTLAGCPAVKTIIVNRLPAPITGATDLCAWGGTVTVADADAPLGAWNSSGLTVSPGGVLTAHAPGVSSVSYTLPTGCYVAQLITVNPLPLPITGLNYVCLGGTITLSSATGGGAWSSASPASVATVDATTGVVHGVGPGIAGITYTLPTGCIATTNIFVNPTPSLIAGDTVVCMGGVIFMNDSVAGGTWISGDPSVATMTISGAGLLAAVTGVSAGTATITYNITNLCGTSGAYKTVTVLPVPDAGVINGLATVCVGVSTTLSTTGTGGNWSIMNNHASLSAGGVATGVIAGADTVVYTLTNMCGTSVAIYPITINPLPDAGTLSGAAEVCAGGEVTLVPSVSGGSWISGSRATITLSGVVSALSAGLDTVAYSISNSCGTAVVTHTLMINPLPVAGTVSGAAEVCVGAIASINNSIYGGAWTLANGHAAFVRNVVTGLSEGIETLTYTVTNGCGYAVTTFTIAVKPLPTAATVAGTDSVCPGDTVALGANINGGTWLSADTSVFIVGINGVVTGVHPGKVDATYTVTNSCGTAATAMPVTVRTYAACDPPAPKEYSVGCSGGNEIILYPNPNPGKFYVKILSAVKEDVQFVVTNAIGQKLIIVKSLTNSLAELELQVAPGIYMVEAITSHGRCTEKIHITR